MNYNRIINFWAILDFCSVGWFIVWSIFHGNVPFYTDIIASINTAKSFENPMPIIMTFIGIIIILSLVVSGFLLIKGKPIASKLVYFQTPLRLIVFKPSVFFIAWPVKYLFNNSETYFAITVLLILFLLSESLKVYSVFVWRKQFSIA